MPTKEKQQKKLKIKKSNFTRPATVFKHKQVLDKLVENGGSLTQAIRDTGIYSEAVISNPSKITNSKSWDELMEAVISDDEAITRHKKLLNSVTVQRFVFSKSDTYEDISALFETIPDHTLLYVQDEPLGIDRYAFVQIPNAMVQDKALDKVYKLRKRYGEVERTSTEAKTTYNFIYAPEVRERVKAMDEAIKGMLINAHVPKTEEDVATSQEETRSTSGA